VVALSNGHQGVALETEHPFAKKDGQRARYTYNEDTLGQFSLHLSLTRVRVSWLTKSPSYVAAWLAYDWIPGNHDERNREGSAESVSADGSFPKMIIQQLLSADSSRATFAILS
jgi:hypothetical protein